MAGAIRFGASKRARFLKGLRSGLSIAAAADLAGVARRTVYYRRERDDGFATDWDAAIEDGTDRLEDEAYRRALEGIEKPVFYQGKPIGRIRDYSDSLLIFMLKARRGDKFRDQSRNDRKDAINVDAAKATLVGKLLPKDEPEKEG